MKYLGDYATSAVIYTKFTTFRPSTGAAFTLGGTPAISVYKDNSTTQSTSGVTLTVDFDSVTGLHHVAIDTSADGSFYSEGSNFDIVITTGTVDGVSVVGTVVASFSIAKVAALRPTTAGRTLDVTATGEAGIDWANIGGPTTTVNLSGTTIKTATDVETDTADIQTRLPAALVSGRIDASVGAMAADVLTNTALAASAVTEIQSGLSTLDAAGVRSAVGLASANLDTQLDSIPTASENADAVWDEAIAGHAGAGSTGAALSAAGSAGDPWGTALPGAYSAGSAGYILGTNLNATVSSRATQTSVDTIDGVVDSILFDTGTDIPATLATLATAADLSTVAGYLDTEISAILADTNELQTDWANGGRLDLILDARASQTSVDTIDDFLDTEIAAIKAKTDNLPASPAATGDIPTATQNADALLNRDMSAVSDTNSRSPLNALRVLRNKWSISGTTITHTKEDDTTTAFTASLTATAGADPITGSDPS